MLQGDGAPLASVLVGDHQLVLAALVAEPADVGTVGRPGRGPLGAAAADRQVAHVTLLGGHREDLATGLEHRALARGRQGRGLHQVDGLGPVGPGPGEVAVQGHGQRAGLAAGRVHGPQAAAVLEDQAAVAAGQVLAVELLEEGPLLQAAGDRVPGPHVHAPVPVAEEEHGVAQPGRRQVVAVGPGQALHLEAGQVDHPHRVALAAAVVAPLAVPLLHHLVGQALAAGAEHAVLRPGQGQGHRQDAVQADGPQLGRRPRRAGAAGGEDHAGAVGGPAAHLVRQRVPGQAHGLAAGRGHHVDVGVAVVLARERHQAAVGREMGIGLGAGEGGQAPGVAAVAVDDPDVVGVHEGDLRGAHVGHAQQQGFLVGGGRRQGDRNEQQATKDHRSHGVLPGEALGLGGERILAAQSMSAQWGSGRTVSAPPPGAARLPDARSAARHHRATVRQAQRSDPLPPSGTGNRLHRPGAASRTPPQPAGRRSSRP